MIVGRLGWDGFACTACDAYEPLSQAEALEENFRIAAMVQWALALPEINEDDEVSSDDSSSETQLLTVCSSTAVSDDEVTP